VGRRVVVGRSKKAYESEDLTMSGESVEVCTAFPFLLLDSLRRRSSSNPLMELSAVRLASRGAAQRQGLQRRREVWDAVALGLQTTVTHLQHPDAIPCAANLFVDDLDGQVG